MDHKAEFLARERTLDRAGIEARLMTEAVRAGVRTKIHQRSEVERQRLTERFFTLTMLAAAIAHEENQ